METRREILRESEPARPRWVPTPPPPPGPWERFRMLLRRSVFPLALLLFVAAVVVFLIRLPGFGGATLGESLGMTGAAEEETDPETAGAGLADEPIPLTIESEPSGARVLIDGEEVGTTPLRDVSMERGAYILSLQMDDYRMPDTLVVLRSGSTSSFSFRMRPLSAPEPEGPPVAEQQPDPEPQPQPEVQQQPTEPEEPLLAEEQPPSEPPAQDEQQLPAVAEEGELDEEGLSGDQFEELFDEEDVEFGDLVVSSEPSGATVILNGVRRGTTPLTLADLQVGPKEVVLQMEGYQEHIEEVEVEGEQIHDITATLEPVQGQLRVLARPWGSIYVDGELHEPETNVRYSVDLPVGTYTVRAEHPVLGSQEREVTIQQGQITSLVIDLNE